MRRSFFALAIAIAGVFASVRPAEASISGASLSTPSSSITKPCAVSVPFTGSINGTPGTAFVYSFNRFVNGVQQIVSGGSATIPGSGSLAVSDTMTFTSSASGKTFDQIWVHNIAGQADVYGNIVYVTVTCGTPPPPPSSIPAPTNLKQTTDPGVCGDHVVPLFGPVICAAALADGKVVLVWDYGDPNSVDGFHIYQTNPAAGLVAKQSGMTGKALDVKGIFLAGYCYVVRAYKGASESGDSNQFCLAGTSNTGTVDLPVLNWRFTYHTRHEEKDALYCPLNTKGTGGRNLDGGFLVGYSHSWDPGTDPFPCWESLDYSYRAAVLFDLSPLAGRKLSKATLTMNVLKGYMDFNANHPLTVSCASEIMYGTSDWSGAHDLIPGDSFLDMPNGVANMSASTGTVQIAGSNVTIDVTGAVRQWMLGRPNHGFVFRGPREDYPHSNEECATKYSTPALRVTYFN